MAPSDLLDFHLFCATDSGTRLAEYARAIETSVQPGDVVLDLGTGTGLLAILACRAGAARVYAIEESDAIALGMQLAASAGLVSRIEFIQGPSSQVKLPEPVDLIVADIHDSFGLQSHGLASLVDARDRFLKPGGTLIPHTIHLRVAPVEAAREYHRSVERWRSEVQGVDLSPIRTIAVNSQHAARLGSAQLLSAPAPLADVDLRTASSLHVGGATTVTVTRSGTLHGICGSFVSSLADGVDIGNAPGVSDTTNFAQAFFPIESPVEVSEGDEISIAMDTLDGTEIRWQVDISGRVSGSRATFDHSTFQALHLSIDKLRKQAGHYHPQLTDRGSMEAALLERCDGSRSVAELLAWLSVEFGELLPSRREAESFLRSTIDRCA